MNRSFYQWVIILTGLFVILFAGCASDQTYWKKAEAVNTIESYEQFLSRHHKSEFASEAESRIDKLRIEEKRLRKEKEEAQRLESANREWSNTVKTDTIDAYINFHELFPIVHTQEVREKIMLVIAQASNSRPAIHNPIILDAHSSVVQKNNRISAHNVKIAYPNGSTMVLNQGFTYGYFGVNETYTMSAPITHISFNSQISYTFVIDEGTLIFKGNKEGLHYISGKGIGLVSDNGNKQVYIFSPEKQ